MYFPKAASIAGCGAAVALSEEKETLRSLISVLYFSTLSVVKFRGGSRLHSHSLQAAAAAKQVLTQV